MRPKLTDEDLINLFFRHGTVTQLAKDVGVTPRDIHRGWQRLKIKNELPMQRPLELWQCSFEDDNREHEFDGRPSVNTADPDPLLTALWHAHPKRFTK